MSPRSGRVRKRKLAVYFVDSLFHPPFPEPLYDKRPSWLEFLLCLHDSVFSGAACVFENASTPGKLSFLTDR